MSFRNLKSSIAKIGAYLKSSIKKIGAVTATIVTLYVLGTDAVANTLTVLEHLLQ